MLNRLMGYIVTLTMIVLVVFPIADWLLGFAGIRPQPRLVEFHPTLGWKNVPSRTVTRETGEFSVTFAMNDKGIRNPPLPYQNETGASRVLFVGDSFTLGYTVDEQDLFLRRFEAAMRARGHDVVAINGGTEGYSTDQELVWLMEEGLKYSPDYVVLAPYLNDIFWNTQPKYADRGKPHYALHGDALERSQAALENPGETSWFYSSTGIGTLINSIRKGGLLPKTQVGGRTVLLEYAPMLKHETAKVTDAYAVTAALLGEFARLVRGGDAKPVALLIPNKWEIHPDMALPGELGGTPQEDIDPSASTKRVADACRTAGFVVVDPAPILKKHAGDERLYFDRDWHWNARGNHLVAEALVEAFIRPDMLGPGTGTAVASEAETVDETGVAASGGRLSNWILIPGIIWLVLGFLFWRSYPNENPLLAYLKVGLLIAFVVGVIYGVGRLADLLPAWIAQWVLPLILALIIGFVLVKIGKRLATISELYGAFLRRGHWYVLPMLVVLVSIGMLLVVAASSPFVAPFIYTLF